MNNEPVQENSHDAVLALVSQAKHRPLPRSSKALFVVVVFALVFTGGIAYGKHKATAGTGTGLSLSALSGGGGFGGGGFGGGRNRGGASGTTGTAGTLSGGTLSGGTGGFGGGAMSTTPTDVAGIVVSVSPTSIVVTSLSGTKETFPVTATTHVLASTAMPLAGVKAGDIVTIKPDSTNSAKTIMVVK